MNEYEDWDYDIDNDEDYWKEPEDYCNYGSFGMPQLGLEECSFSCPMRESCNAIYNEQKRCILSGPQDWPECIWFHMGHCYMNFSNYTPSRLRQIVIRIKCHLGILPKNPDRRTERDNRN